MINGTAGARMAGINPPARAIKLGIKARTMALLIPSKNKAIIRIAFTIGPVAHCRWMKKGKIVAIAPSARNCAIAPALTPAMAFSLI